MLSTGEVGTDLTTLEYTSDQGWQQCWRPGELLGGGRGVDLIILAALLLLPSQAMPSAPLKSRPAKDALKPTLALLTRTLVD